MKIEPQGEQTRRPPGAKRIDLRAKLLGYRDSIRARVTEFSWRLGRRLYAVARYDNLGSNISTNGEAHLQASIAGLQVESGRAWTVIDVGANQGQWSTSMIRAAERSGSAKTMRIVAIEPVPTTASILRNTLAEMEGAGSVEIVEAAMSSHVGEATIFVRGVGAGTNSLYKGQRTGSTPDLSTDVEEIEIRVQTQTLDALSHELGITSVELVKVDAEGHDFEVMKGSAQLLSGGRIGVLQFEYNHRWIAARHYLYDVFELVDGMPYVVGRVTPSGTQFFARWHPELERFFEANYVLVRRDIAVKLPHTTMAWTARNTAARDASGG